MPRLRPLFLGARLRRSLARRPWIRWTAVAALAGGAGLATFTQVQALDDSRARWDDGVEVIMLRAPVAAGQRIDPSLVITRRLPPDAVPSDGLAALPTVATARRPIAAWMVVRSGDIGEGPAPGALVTAGSAGVAVLLPADQRPPLSIGDSVGLVMTADPIDADQPADGDGLLATAQVIDIAPTVVLVAVPADLAPGVAEAAASARITLVLLAEGPIGPEAGDQHRH